MNAINLPLSPIPFELDPEDTMLGNCATCLFISLAPSMYLPHSIPFLFIEENEVRTMVDPNSRSDPKLQELMKVRRH